jgi:hypothetical protein
MDSVSPGGRAASRPVIRNVVQINPEPDALGFAAAAFARGARLVRLRELGATRLTSQILAPSVPAMKIWLPDGTALGQGDAAAQAMLANLRPARVMIVHRAPSPARLAALLAASSPDALCLGPEAALAAPPPGLAPCDPGLDLSGCGLGGLRFFANETGAVVLVEALAALDAARRRRLREREHVYDVEDFVACSGLYATERDAWGGWAWTGPETIATFLAPMHGGERVRLTLFFFANKRPLDAENIRVLVDGRSFVSRYFPDEMKIEITGLGLGLGLGDAAFARFDLVQSVTVPTEDMSRRLGFALHKLKVEVEP